MNPDVEFARVMWGGFYRCPTTGRILTALKGDNKVLCNCGRSNPKVAQERTGETGTHVIRFLEPATPEEFVAQERAEL